MRIIKSGRFLLYFLAAAYTFLWVLLLSQVDFKISIGIVLSTWGLFILLPLVFEGLYNE